MGDEASNHFKSQLRGSTKGRSASICAPGSTSLEALVTQVTINSNPPSRVETPEATRRRGKPAARSQSARITGGRSIRRKPHHPPNADNAGNLRSGNSEPRLNDTPEPSPSIKRKSSRKAPPAHRKSAAFLDVPNSRPNDEDDDSYRLRSFSSTSKGIINRGDSFRRRRSRSSSLCPGAEQIAREHSSTRSRNNEVHCYHVALLGAPGVGKAALISQFMTSECINAYDRQRDADGIQSISIMLDREESELHFSIITNAQDIERTNVPDAFVVLYSVVDRSSITRAELELRKLEDMGLLRVRPVLVVANKIDLARSRAVSAQDGKCLACTYRAKFIEISVGINHNVDELLVGILSQIRLKEAQQPNGTLDTQPQWFKSRGVMRASMKARQMFTWIFGKEDSKFKNCENLHIL